MSRYASFAELARHEAQGEDFGITERVRPGARVLVVAPHGGLIEEGTSQIAHLIAGAEHSLFCFEGIKPFGHNRELHITSHCFDHPDCVALAARHARVVGIHGCRGAARIFLGGLDSGLISILAARLAQAGFVVECGDHPYPGRHPQNICNRGSLGRGAQIEITHDLRTSARSEDIAAAVRLALADLGAVGN